MEHRALIARTRADERMNAVLPELAATRRELARLQAQEARLLSEAREIAEDWAADEAPPAAAASEFPHRSIAAEIAALWRVSDRTVARQIDEAATLVTSYPATLDALHSGEISRAHVVVIIAAGAVITRSELRAEYEQTVLEVARTESASRLGPIAKRRAQWYAEDTLDDRHRRERERRRTWVTDLDDGMSELAIYGPAALIHGIYDRATAMARDVRETGVKDRPGVDGGDERTIDQLRADILCDLMLAAEPVAHDGATGLGSIQATVHITVPVLSLIGDDCADPFELAMLNGRQPIDAQTARSLTADAVGWERVLIHPITGSVLEVDTYRPTEQLRRHLRVRDQHCRFPGCRAPAHRADIDHTIDAARGGPTTASNLAHLCRRHHTLKHHSPWTVTQRGGGVLEWRSPTGRMYTDVPISGVAFASDPESAYEDAPF